MMAGLEVSLTKSVVQHELQNECLSCPICYEVFKEPKILSCLHRFCEGCIHDYITSMKTEETATLKGFKCPICRSVTSRPDKKLHYSQWASLLKTDFHLKSVIRFVESKATIVSNQTLPAAQQFLCHHKDEVPNEYCFDCCKPICSKCKCLAHKACKNILSIAVAAADRRALAGIWSRTLITKLEKVDNVEASRMKFLDALEDEKMRAEWLIEKRKEEIQRLLQDQEEKLLTQLHKQYEIYQEKISASVIQFNDKLVGYKEGLHELSRKVETASDYELVTDDSVFSDFDAIRCRDIDIQSYEEFVSGISQMKIEIIETEPFVEIGISGVTLSNPRANATATLTEVGTNQSSKDLVFSGASNELLLSDTHEKSDESHDAADVKTMQKFRINTDDDVRVRSALEELKIL